MNNFQCPDRAWAQNFSRLVRTLPRQPPSPDNRNCDLRQKTSAQKSSPEQRRWKKNFKAWSNIWIIFVAVAAPATKIETNPRMFSDATCFFLEKINCRLFSLFFAKLRNLLNKHFGKKLEKGDRSSLSIPFNSSCAHTHSSTTHPCSETRVQHIHEH